MKIGNEANIPGFNYDPFETPKNADMRHAEINGMKVIEASVFTLFNEVDKLMASSNPDWEKVAEVAKKLAGLLCKQSSETDLERLNQQIDEMVRYAKKIHDSYDDKMGLALALVSGTISLCAGIVGVGAGMSAVSAALRGVEAAKLAQSIAQTSQVAGNIGQGIAGFKGPFDDKNSRDRGDYQFNLQRFEQFEGVLRQNAERSRSAYDQMMNACHEGIRMKHDAITRILSANA